MITYATRVSSNAESDRKGYFDLFTCARCNIILKRKSPQNPDLLFCPGCGARIQEDLFPAHYQKIQEGSSGKPLVWDDEAGCFFHPDKQAVVPCDICGRFLCALCDIDFNGRHFCPTCLAVGKQKGKLQELQNRYTLYDNIALALAFLPVFVFFLIFFSAITAPIAVFMAIKHWNTPLSIVPRTKIRYIVAILLAGLQITGWVWFVLYLITKK
jgi:Zn-finger nucleic acid-binding protein